MSDRIIKAAERIQDLYHQGIYQEETDKIAAILREAFPAPSAQGEDERALAISRDGLLQLQLALNDAVNDIVGVFPPQTDIKKALIKAANDYINGVADYIAALRSRLAEPAASTATARAKAIAAHGYLANPDDVGRVAHLLEQMEPAPECPYCGPDGTLRHGDSERICPDCGGTHETKLEPAQAAPSEENALEDLDAMKRRLMDESDAMNEVTTHRWWWRYSQNVDSRLRAALASERAKREDRAPGYVCPACGQRYIDPEAVVTLDKLVKQASPAPDAAALRARVLVACIETESALARHEVEHGDGWLYNHADVILGYETELEALLRSEPRGETK